MKKALKKILKSSLSFVLAFTIIFSSAYVGLSEVDFSGLFAVKAKAANLKNDDSENAASTVVEENIETSNEYLNEEVTEKAYIYYSDLFYGYPNYLADDEYLKAYIGAAKGIYNSVYQSYLDSPLLFGTGLEHALDIVVSPAEIAKLITDKYGLTDFSYNDALDAANEAFVAYMMSDTLSYSVKGSYGKVAKINNQLNTMVTYFNKLELTDNSGNTYTAERIVQDAYDYLWDKGCLSFISEEMLFQLWDEINAQDFSVNSCFKLAKNEIEIASAIVTALMMENIRLELIDDIISIQTGDTVLKQGMVRLKNKLRGGFVSYFIENYLVKKLADDLFGVIDKLLIQGFDAVANEGITSIELKALVSVAKTVFNYVVDVPKFDEVIKWQVLIAYSHDLSNTITNKAISFTEGPFISDEILKYENYFILYDAVNKATMAVTKNIAEMLDPFGNAYTVLEEARANNIAEVTIKSGTSSFSIPSTTTYEELKAILIADTYVAAATGNVYSLLKEVQISNGTRTEKIARKANTIGSIVQSSISENIELIYAFENACSGKSLYGEHINNAMDSVLNLSKEVRLNILEENHQGWTYKFDSTWSFSQASDTIIPKSVYAVSGVIWGSLKIYGYTSINNDLTISDNLYYNSTAHSMLTIGNNAEVIINGDIDVNAYSTSIQYSGMEITAGSKLKVLGNVSLNAEGSPFKLNLYGTLETEGDLTSNSDLRINQGEKSYLKICGDFTRTVQSGSFGAGVLEVQGNCNARISGGSKYTVILSGSQLQNISNLTAPTIIINNSNGVNFNSSIKPTTLFNHNGNPFTLYNNDSSSTFVDYDGDGLKDNVDPYPTVGNPCTITVLTENSEKGTVTESFESFCGTTVTVTATPTSKYIFYCWKDANNKVVSQNATYTFVAKGDTKLTAYFTKRQRNITTNIQNGTLTVPSKAEIESTVTVTPVPNEGCVFVADSITVNGKAIKGNTFVMPDENVVIGAQFYVNEHYFTLKEVLTEATGIDRTLYSSATASELKTAIDNAQNSLVNTISQAESEARITELEKTMNNLILIKGSCGDSLEWNYDEDSKFLILSGSGTMSDYTDSDSPWETFENEITTVVIGRDITSIGDNAFKDCAAITDVYYGYTAEKWQTLSIGENNKNLTSANIHCHTHNFVGTVTTKPTCTQQGVKTFNCDCGDVYTENVDALGHDYSDEWTIDTEVTCTTDGSKSHHCTVCDEKTDITVIDAVGHDYSTEWTIDIAVTCITDGSKSRHCTVCDDKIDITAIVAPGHSYSEDWIIDLEATCTENGSKSYHCAVCGDKKDVTVIPATGHNYSTEWTIDLSPTCTEEGSKSYHCLGCDDKKDITVIPANGHSYGDWVIDLEATCTEDGSRSKTCTGCNDLISETIITTGHDYADEWTIDFAPTCIKNGSKSRHCTKCDSKTDEIVISPLGHSYGNAVIEREPTCTKTGSRYKVCSACNRKSTEVIPALGHSFSEEWTIDIPATCTTTGQKSHHCTRCDAKIDYTVIDATGHNYVTTVEPTHPHTTTKKCSFCNDEHTEVPYVSNCVECNFTIVAVDSDSYKLVSYIGTGKNIVVPTEYNDLPITKIEANCFKGNTTIKSVEIPEGITTMGNAVFYGCTNLESVRIPSTVTSTGNAAFYNCISLKSVKIADGVTTIGNSAFRGCTSIEAITIPESVTTIGTQAFYGFTGTIYCTKDSTAHNYAVANNFNFVFINDMHVTEKEDTHIDYENLIIQTTVQSCADISDILGVSDSARIVVTASCKQGGIELLGTGTVISVYEGDTHIGDYKLVVNGDTNGDSICDALDCFEVERAANGNTDLSGVYAMAADSNSDNVVDITDYQAIVNKALAS